MSDIQAEIRSSADGLAHRDSGQKWLALLARAGMVAQATMYLLVGGLAIELALGLGGKTTDQRGALHTLADEWYGLGALFALAVGFAGYAIWRFAVAVLGEKIESEEDVGVGKRLVYAARALLYASLCYSALALAFSRGGGSRTRRTRRPQPSSTGQPAVGSWEQRAWRSSATASGTATAPSAGTSRRISRSSR
jgi:hypothetical protein